jgi:cation:H+ antiporter
MGLWGLLLGSVLLYFGAEWLVGGGSRLALALRVPQLLIGLTIVAYGTSAPEVVIGIQAAAAGHAAIAFGNVVGSNIANIGLILGLGALISPPRVDGGLRRRELPVLLATAAAVPLVALDGVVTRVEGCFLLACALLYTIVLWRSTHGKAADVAAIGDAADAAGAPKLRGAVASLATAVAGLVALIVGGSVFVDGAIDLAHRFNISERVIGLTIVAVGTSLPELVTTLIAARRGHADIAIGNVVGSNIFNVLVCLGAAATVSPFPVGEALGIDNLAMLGFTVLAAVFIRSARLVSRVEGAIALTLYIVFMVSLAAR